MMNAYRSILVLGFAMVAMGCSGDEDSGSQGNAGNGGGGGTTPNGGSGGIGAGSGLPDDIPRSPPGTCRLPDPAFCEQFDMPHPGGRGGDIDESKWSFARWGHVLGLYYVRMPSTQEPDKKFPSTFCNQPFSGLLPPDGDVRICDGIGVDGLVSTQLNEVFDDQYDFGFNSFRIRQLFDFTDRTGKITIDVDAKINPLNVGHGWWFEVFITDDAAPMPYHEAPGVLSYPRNGIGFAFKGFADCPESEEVWMNELDRVFVSHNYEIIHDYPPWLLGHEDYEKRCFHVADNKLNHIEILISQNRAEVWAGDHTDPLTLRQLSVAEPLDLSFTRGYIHLQHAHYNARKDGDVTGVQTYRWDNVGFDGPAYAPARAYEFPDNNEIADAESGAIRYGHFLTETAKSIQATGVELREANRATIDFTLLANTGRTLLFKLNGGPEHSFTVPTFTIGTVVSEGLRSFSAEVPIEEIVDGTNTLEVRMQAPQPDPFEAIANVELTLETNQ